MSSRGKNLEEIIFGRELLYSKGNFRGIWAYQNYLENEAVFVTICNTLDDPRKGKIMTSKDIFTAEEVAEYLRIHPYTVRRLARAGKCFDGAQHPELAEGLPGFSMSP